MAIPDYQTLMLPALRLLGASRASTPELVARLSDELRLSIEEREQLLPSGQKTAIANRVHWSIAYLNRAGLVSRLGKGLYDITPRGREVLASPPDRITIGFLRQFHGFRDFRPETGRSAVTSEFTAATGTNVAEVVVQDPDERLEMAGLESREALVGRLLDRVRELQPAKFEQLIVDLLLGMGYGGTGLNESRRIGRSGDGGVDGVIQGDPLGLDVIYVQAKRYAEDNSVGSAAIREFAGSLMAKGATKGVFATTSRFTKAAESDLAQLSGHRWIVLIDGAKLARLMIEYEVGVRVRRTIRTYDLDLEPYEDADTA